MLQRITELALASFYMTVYTCLLNVQASNHKCIVKSINGVSIRNAVIQSYHIPSFHSCYIDCKKNTDCKSINYFVRTSLCQHNSLTISDKPSYKSYDDEATYMDNSEWKYIEPKKTVLTESGWTLIARFSNSDTKNWLNVSGYWWYDLTKPQGDTINTNVNKDMIAQSFWTTKGQELKVTRTDDSSHTPLLVTTSSCLAGKTFRQKISGYGDFRNGKIWSSDRCLGKCTVKYSGNYKSTAGFSKTSCDSGVLNRNQIGFWCDYSAGAGAVFSIGGAGSACDRADHGIAVTEQNAGRLGTSDGCDFGDEGQLNCAKQSYALNLWVK